MRVLIMLFSLVSFIFASVGEIRAINGSADIVRKFSKVSIKLGTKLENGDMIKTYNNTKLQIVFNDNTVISLGQKTDFKIDDYIFTSKKVKAHFSVTKGIFKSITGRIGKIDKSKFKLKTNNATIGVRGTTFMGSIIDGKETIGCTSGEIFIQTPKGNQVVKKGEMTTVIQNTAPSAVKKLDIKSLKVFKEVVSKKEVEASKNIKANKKKSTKIAKAKKKKIQTIKKAKKVAKKKYNKAIKEAKKKSPKETKKVIKQAKKVAKKKYNKAIKEAKKKLPKETKKVIKQAKKQYQKTIKKAKKVANKEYRSTIAKIKIKLKKDKVYTSRYSNTESLSEVDNELSNDNAVNPSTDTVEVDNTPSAASGEDFADFDSVAMAEVEDAQEKAQEDITQPVAEVRGYQALIQKAGSSNPTYSGSVSGTAKWHVGGITYNRTIVENDGYNEVKLNFDLGGATVEGSTKFKVDALSPQNRDWNTQISGSVGSDGNFDFQATGNNYGGGGSGGLSGDTLQNASGDMAITHNGGTTDATFTATKD